MNMIDTLTTLIDAARQLPENTQLNRAIKRAERNLAGLRKKQAWRDLHKTVYDSLEEANSCLPKCRGPLPTKDGHHNWRLMQYGENTNPFWRCKCISCFCDLKLSTSASELPPSFSLSL